ncbi:hypothetical protein CAPTEDRAFT_223263 [Capitella teleta]|uniref:PDZ domain-containing protein n=1 Tax=Capitella teleta TaxID=283909 RepID=R7UMS9_CAPTE|nr:hypothetical protein CAPTEDRAFT_223263 [Capitella teleta]|eukprot:ELU07403.1 hypothetical protein CAPTEDRAFT_223263 [Capitella teleta]
MWARRRAVVPRDRFYAVFKFCADNRFVISAIKILEYGVVLWVDGRSTAEVKRRNLPRQKNLKKFSMATPGGERRALVGFTKSAGDMYSDSSSSSSSHVTSTSSSSGDIPGFIKIPLHDTEKMDAENIHPNRGSFRQGKKSHSVKQQKMLQAYKGELKINVYVNYGLLTVHLIEGKQLKSQMSDLSDTYIKVSLMPDELRRTKCKTAVVYSTNNPHYDEKFSFELLDEDMNKRLLISVWHRDSHHNQCEFLGCMSFGLLAIQSQRKSVQGWYYLLSGEIGKRKHLQVSENEPDYKSGVEVFLIIPAGNKMAHVKEEMHDVLTIVVRKPKGGYGFSLTGACPVKVARVDYLSAAEVAGLHKDDCIMRIDGQNVSRSSSESVARIIRHADRKVTLEVQRLKLHVETTFPASCAAEPRTQPFSQPLCSSTPYTAADEIGDVEVSPWRQDYHERRNLFQEKERPSFDTHDYGWLDGGHPMDENHHPVHRGHPMEHGHPIDHAPLPYEVMQVPDRYYGWIDAHPPQSVDAHDPPPPYEAVPSRSPKYKQKLETILESPLRQQENNYVCMDTIRKKPLPVEQEDDIYVPMYRTDLDQPELEWDSSADHDHHYEDVIKRKFFDDLPQSLDLLKINKYHPQPKGVSFDDSFIGKGALDLHQMVNEDKRYSTLPRKKNVMFTDFD